MQLLPFSRFLIYSSIQHQASTPNETTCFNTIINSEFNKD